MSIRRKLALAFVVFAVLPQVLVAYAAFMAGRAELLEANANLLEQRAENTLYRLNAVLDSYVLDTITWTRDQGTYVSFETSDPKFLEQTVSGDPRSEEAGLSVIVLRNDRSILSERLNERLTPAREALVEIVTSETAALEASPQRTIAVSSTLASHSVVVIGRRIIDEFDDPIGFWFTIVGATPIAELAFTSLSTTDHYTAILDANGDYLASSRPREDNRKVLQVALEQDDVIATNGTRSARAYFGEDALLFTATPRPRTHVSQIGWSVAAVLTRDAALSGSRNLRNAILGFVIVWLTLAAIVGSTILGRQLRPLLELTHAAKKAVDEGDLTGIVPVQGNDEIAVLARSLGYLIREQRGLLKKLKDLAAAMSETAGDARSIGDTVAAETKAMTDGVRATEETVRGMDAFLQEVARNASLLRESTERSTEATHRMQRQGSKVMSTVNEVGDAIEGAGKFTQQMVATSNSLQATGQSLSRYIEDTVDSARETHALSKTAASRSVATETLSARAVEAAGRGMESLGATLVGIQEIAESYDHLSSGVRTLASRVQEIGTILHVIDEVAKKTKLLSLNASIIATGAGEHGKAISIVAGQIEELAMTTRDSTVLADSLITAAERESTEALEVMNESMIRVERGVKLGSQTRDFLNLVVESIRESNAMVKSIADDARIQAGCAEKMTSTADLAAGAVEELTESTEKQADTARKLDTRASGLHNQAGVLDESVSEVVKGGQEIDAVIRQLSKLAAALDRNQSENARRSSAALERVQNIKTLSDERMGAVNTLLTNIQHLHGRVARLEGHLQNLKLETTRRRRRQ